MSELPADKPFPIDHPAYAWAETPAEVALREQLLETLLLAPASYLGASKATLSVDCFIQGNNLPSVASGTDRIEIGQYDESDQTVFTDVNESIGLRTTVTAKERYRATANDKLEPIEPLNLMFGISESIFRPGLLAHIIVPSRYFTEHAGFVDYDRQKTECRPPHAQLYLGAGVGLAALADSAQLSLAVADMPDDQQRDWTSRLVDRTIELFSTLGIENMPLQSTGERRGTIELSEEQMQRATEWLAKTY